MVQAADGSLIGWASITLVPTGGGKIPAGHGGLAGTGAPSSTVPLLAAGLMTLVGGGLLLRAGRGHRREN